MERANWIRWAMMAAVLAAVLGAVLMMAGCQNQNQSAESGAVDRSGWPAPATWDDETWEADTLAWRDERLARLLLPDGYLSLAALDFYEPGLWTVGQSDLAVVGMPTGPDIWGELLLAEGQAWFVPASAADDEVRVEYPHPEQADPPLPGAVRLSIAGDEATTSRVGGGEAHFYVAIRKGDWVVRVRDPNSRARQDFVGLDHYPLDRDFQVVAEFEPHPPGTTIPTATVLGELLDEPNPGRVVFELGDDTFSLEAIAAASGDEFFFILADRTSGGDTYGLGRFLYSDLPNEEGLVVLDFNRAYNPPCAFNAFTTCPLPPPENRIDYPIEAGELKYAGKAGQDPDQLPVN